MNGSIAILLKSFPTFPGYERPSSHAALPLLARAGHAFAGLALLGLPLLLIALLVVALRARGWAAQRVSRSLLVWLAIIACGALVAAADLTNARGWNPALYGAVFVAASLPAALAAGLPGDASVAPARSSAPGSPPFPSLSSSRRSARSSSSGRCGTAGRSGGSGAQRQAAARSRRTSAMAG
jgi:hypothetical protein